MFQIERLVTMELRLFQRLDAVFLTGSKLLYQILPTKLFFGTPIFILFESLGM